MGFVIDVQSPLARQLAVTLGAGSPYNLEKVAPVEGKKGKGKIDFGKLRASAQYGSRFINLGEKLPGACWAALAVDNGDGNVGSENMIKDMIIETTYSCEAQKKRNGRKRGKGEAIDGLGFARLFSSDKMQCNASNPKGTIGQVNLLLQGFSALTGHPWSEAVAETPPQLWAAVCQGEEKNGTIDPFSGEETAGTTAHLQDRGKEGTLDPFK